ncbi:MAG: hypothetical protein ABI861_10100 [Panacibacter sp.]
MKKKFCHSFGAKNLRLSIPIFAFVFFTATCLHSCKKQGTTASSGIQQTTSSAITVAISKQQALDRLNAHFQNEFSTIKMQQVKGVNRGQFTQWLRNSQASAAESLYLGPVLASGGNEYVILKNVRVKQTGQLASVGLIAVTPQFYGQFTRMVAVINYNFPVDPVKHICSWRKCDSYEPCPCVLWIDFVSGDCPSDKCIVDENCAHFSATDCDGQLTGITTFDVLSAF